MEENNINDDLAAIRGLMERSQKFISLSGLSGIMAGVYALIGAGAAHYVIRTRPSDLERLPFAEQLGTLYSDFFINLEYLFLIAVAVLIASLVTGYFLTKRQARRKGQAMWGRISRSLLFYMAIPLLSGGALILIAIYQGAYFIVAPATLIFYGLSLVSASNFTFTVVKYLGICEIILGLLTACLPGCGLLFWAIGFGVLHIIYGSLMYLKYDR